MQVAVVDAETTEILPRPEYPPRPVGVAIKAPGKKPRYVAFAHPTANNGSYEDAKRAVTEVWHLPLCFHNASFDIEVICKFFDLPMPPWQQINDTVWLGFLNDPHSHTLELKPLSEKLLGLPPEERDAVRDWLVSHKICAKNDKKWGRFICKAPGDIVGRYACGDVDRTYKLFKLLHPRIKKLGMAAAYDRERELMPMLMRNEQIGLRVDVPGLTRDCELYRTEQEKAEKWIRRHLKAPGLNLDADQDVADALERAKEITEWVYTAPTARHPEGVRSVSKKNLKIKNPKLNSVFGYRNRAVACLSTFMEPWLQQASKTGGTIHPKWNQTRNPDDKGTRTGRPSVTKPNLLNITKDYSDKNDGYVHPEFLKVTPLPLIRRYILPDEGCLFGHEDFNQQEWRITAHFEQGRLMAAYNADPLMDMHVFTKAEILRVAMLALERRPVKIANFLMLYGGGIPKLVEQLGCSNEEAQKIKAAQALAIPDVVTLNSDLKREFRNNNYIRTWGGRMYHCEPPSNGRTYEYKALNYLVQGSAADVTKQAVINYHKAAKHGRFLVTVYDEINISVPPEHLHEEMRILREVMESTPMDVFMKVDSKVGPSWGDLKEYKEREREAA